jgi:hypothetical protein
MAHNLQDKLAFAWRVHYVMRKHHIIISAAAVKLCVVRMTHKLGIELPKPGKDTIEWWARKLDHKTSNTLWMTALEKELGNLTIAFKLKNAGTLFGT